MGEPMSIPAAPPAPGAIGDPVIVEVVLRQIADIRRAVIAIVVPGVAVPAGRQLVWAIADAGTTSNTTWPPDATGPTDTADSSNTTGSSDATGPTDTTDSSNTAGPPDATRTEQAATGAVCNARAGDRTVRRQLRRSISGDTPGTALGRDVEEIPEIRRRGTIRNAGRTTTSSRDSSATSTGPVDCAAAPGSIDAGATRALRDAGSAAAGPLCRPADGRRPAGRRTGTLGGSGLRSG